MENGYEVKENEIESLEYTYHNLYKDSSVTDLRTAATEINSQIQEEKGNLGRLEYDKDNYYLLLGQYKKKRGLIKGYIKHIIKGGYGDFFFKYKKFSQNCNT